MLITFSYFYNFEQFIGKLKYLNMTFSKKLKRLPDFSGVPNLEKLILKGCDGLTEVHPSLLHHKKVVLMNLEDCKSLKSLPGKLEMSSLEKLILSGCCEFKILPEFGESMENLSMLALEGIAIRNLPSSLGSLVGLASLNLKNCKSLVCLPDTIHRLNSLIILNISGCSRLCRLPDGLKEIKCLKELHANDTAIDELPSSIFYLDNLKTSTGFRFPTSLWNLPSLRYINLSYCNLSEESIPDYLRHLSSLKSLDLTGNNFVYIPSTISKLPKLHFLYLNCCQKLQLLPEISSSMTELDASNCDSLETTKFNPAKPCSVFASPRQLSYVEKKINSFIEGLCLPSARFDMLIPGKETPSCYADPPELCNHEIDCCLFSSNAKLFVTTRTLPPMNPYLPHLYILYLSIDQFRDRILKDDYWSENGIEFVLKCYCCHSLQIVKCGCRLVCKQDVKDWNKVMNQFNES
ncbi:TMV resistance protein N [Medicago truncatula]|uniref:TMV resistance protein N n=1 Tax=Medicago truncatula TaxID=3880 RepID=UPI0019675BF4|nr:TMV resistance protein N [Medicago truncatula]